MKFVADIAQQTWKLVEDDSKSSHYSINIFFGFRDNGSLPVNFDNLSFGIYMRDSHGFSYIREFPEGSAKYIRTDQDYLLSCDIHSLVPENIYVIDLWATNSGEKFEKTFNIELPRPPQPWKSWTYNEELYLWEPPVPIPDDGNFYDWEEETLSWIPINDG